MNKLIKALVVLLLPLTGYSQYWMKSGGGPFNDGSGAMAVTPSGDIVSTIWFSGFINFNSLNYTSAGGTDILLINSNANGIIQSVKQIGGMGDDRALSVAVDNTGNIALSGFFSQTLTSGSVTLNASGSQDAFILKLDNSGNAVWGIAGGGPYNDAAVGVAFDNSGNIVSTGNFTGSVFIGSTAISSTIEPLSGLPSQDVFIVAYGPAGNQLWLQKGGSKYSDKAVGIVTDNNGNVYTTGQYSDTIQFVNQHPNTASNAIYLVKFSSVGAELWFTWAGGGGFSNVRDIAIDGNSGLYLSGDCAGNIQFAGPPLINTSNTYQYRVFLAKYNLNGQPLWAETDGSASIITGGPLAVDPAGDVYVSGLFKCKMNEYSDQYGQGLFNSVGYNDIFVAKYSSAGARVWSRNAGGTKEDEVTDMLVLQIDKPFLIGSFSDQFSCTCDPNAFQVTTGTFLIDSPNSSTVCSDVNYGKFAKIASAGGRDFFLGRFIDINRLPYDYYARPTSACSFPQVDGCVSVSATDFFCQDQTTIGCGGFSLYANTNTSSSGPGAISPGPNFIYQWNTGSPSKNFFVNGSGSYTATITSEDGCFSSSDSISVVVNQIPSKPTITDSKFVNINSSTPQLIQVCAPDSVVFTATNIPPGATVQWTYNAVITTGPALTIYANSSGNYNAIVTYTLPNGCSSTNGVFVIARSSVLQPSKPFINIPDTVTNCGIPVSFVLNDSITGLPCSIPQIVSISWSSVPFMSILGSPLCNQNMSASFIPGVLGAYVIQAVIVRGSVCAGFDTVVVSKSVTVQTGTPPTINATLSPGGTINLCPGSSVSLTAGGGTSYQWNQGQTTNSITVFFPGNYCVVVTKTDSSGCTASQQLCQSIAGPIAPVIAGGNSNLLLCPGDSVLLVAVSKGIQYSWVGPGITSVNNDSIYVKAAGTFYCNITDTTNCTLISNSIEVVQYFTPYISAFPSSLICQGDSVRLNVESSPNALVVWNSPLVGTNSFQYVSQPGVYSCSLTSCGIVTNASISIFVSNVSASLNQQDTSLCFGDSLLLVPAPFSGTAIWFPDSIYSNQLTVNSSGTYYVQITDPNGCSANSNAIIVNFDSVPRPLQILASTPLCEDEQLLISPVLGGGTGVQWIGPAGFSSSIPDIVIDSVKPSQGGYYVITVSDGVCRSIPDSIEIVVYAKIPNYSFNVSPACGGDTLQIATNPTTLYQFNWIDPNGLIITDSVITIPNYSAAQSGYYQLAVSNGTCPSYLDSIFVPLPSTGFINLQIIDTTACVGDTMTLSASGSGGIYTWYPSGNTGSNTIVTNPGIVYCTLIDTAGCEYLSDSINLFFHLPPTITGLSNDSVCAGDSIVLNPVVFPGSLSAWSFNWIGPQGFNSVLPTVQIPQATIGLSGNYSLIVSDGVCNSTAQALVDVKNPPPVPTVNAVIPECLGKALIIVATSQGLSQFVKPDGSILFNDTLFIPVTTFADTGYYYFNAAFGNCASAYDSVQIVFDSCKVSSQDWYIPNIFTPNNDGVNELFVPLLPFGEDGTLKIYNRWGDLLFTGLISKGWDGRDSGGNEQAPSTYYWIMIPDANGKWLSKNGFVELIK